MSLWQWLFGRREQPAPEASAESPEQAVLVYLRLSDDNVGTDDERRQIHALSNALEAVLKDSPVGDFDGEEFDDGRCTLYLYGPEADALFAAIEPTLRSHAITRGGTAIKCYAPIPGRDPDEVEVPL